MRSRRAPPPRGFWCLVCHREAVWLCQSHLESLGLFSEACIPLGRRWFEPFRSRTLMGFKNVPFRTSPPPGSTSKSSDWVRQMPSYLSIPCQWCLGLAVIACLYASHCHWIGGTFRAQTGHINSCSQLFEDFPLL